MNGITIIERQVRVRRVGERKTELCDPEQVRAGDVICDLYGRPLRYTADDKYQARHADEALASPFDAAEADAA